MQIRRIAPEDVAHCETFGIEAFRPVFASFRHYYGESLFNALRPDWENKQAEYIREVCSDTAKDNWVAVVDERVVGFIVLKTEPEARLGQIEIMAVDPEYQGDGVGTALTRFGVDRLRELGMAQAIVGTGSDPSHDPARQVYLKAGFEPMAIQPVYLAQEL